MLEVEIDVFSGQPNPTFQLSTKEEQELVDRIVSEPGQVSSVAESMENLGLGYRGVIVRLVKTDAGPWSKAATPADRPVAGEATGRPGNLPVVCRLGTGSTTAENAADWLLTLAERKNVAIGDTVWDVLRDGVHLLTADYQAEAPPEGEFDLAASPEAGIAPRGATWWACNSPYYSANASYFNTPEAVTRNNCYCFASNHLANVRFALPGKRGGRPATSITCGGVIDGLRADGWIDGCQVNTLTIAMVIWPDPVYPDYHFYRVVTGGPDWWWGHKPGGTPARYTDNSGRALRQPLSPEVADRGPYIHFCGYFYQNNDTAYVA
jgi:hypothetical protein